MVLQGLWCWLWPRRGWDHVDLPALAADLHGLGIGGVVPHNRFTAAEWLYDTRDAKPVDRVKPLLAAGLKVACGIGRAGGLDDQPREACAAAINTALALPYKLPAVLDWEGAYDLPGGRDKARWIADAVLQAHPDAPERVVDAPWWAPLFHLSGEGSTRVRHPTHPSAPYLEFGRLARERYVQAYGTVDGESLRMLAWARDPSQYPDITARAGIAPWVIRGAFVTYRRTWQDVARTLLLEPNCILWDYEEMDAACRLGLQIVRELRAQHYEAPDGLARFAADHTGGDETKVPAALGLQRSA